MTRDVGFANPHAFCIFTKKGDGSLLDTVSKALRRASLLVEDSGPSSLFSA